MKREDEKDEQAAESSRRKFIKTAAVGLTATVVGGTTPVANALQGRGAVQAERGLIECTIGQATRMMMDSSSTTAPDMVAIYRSLGGRNQFSMDLLAETFGSSSMNKQGAVALRPGMPPDFDMLASALAMKAEEVARASTAAKKPMVVELKTSAPTPANSVFRMSSPAAGGKPKPGGGGGGGVNTGDITINC